MLKTERAKEKSQAHIQNVIDHLSKRGVENIKASIEGYEDPTSFRNQAGEYELVPDITGLKNGRKRYIEIAHKTPKKQRLVTKWRLFSTLANHRQGSFQIFVPRGHMSFTQRILSRYKIDAEVIKI